MNAIQIRMLEWRGVKKQDLPLGAVAACLCILKAHCTVCLEFKAARFDLPNMTSL